MAEQSIQKPAEQIVLEIAKQALDNAKEITVLVGLIREQNTGEVNKRLSEAGAGNAAKAVRNALIARLVILAARAYAKPRHGDRHVQVAANLLNAASTRQHFNEKGDKDKLASFDAQWIKCKADERLPKVKNFRDKYTAHLGEPEDIEDATYKELFEFAAETAKAKELLALATGVSTKSVLTDPELTAVAEIFWRPWKMQAKPSGP
jgi:AbiU2